MKIQLIITLLFITVNAYSQEKATSELVDSTRRRIAYELTQIYGLDQGIRSNDLLHYNECRTGIMLAIDSINYKKFFDIVKAYGYPSRSLLGDYWTREPVGTTGLVILFHNPKRIATEKDIYQLLKQEVLKGNLHRDILAEALDKYYVLWEGKSLYNSQWKNYPKLTVRGVRFIDKKLSDSLRTDIGLPFLRDDEFVNE